MTTQKWPCFCSIEEMLDSYGRKHWQVTRKQDGKVVKPFDRYETAEHHLPHTAKRIQEKVPGLSYRQYYDCCVEDYKQGRRPVDLEACFEWSDDWVSMQTKTREQLQRVEMGTGAEYAPRLVGGGWVCCEAQRLSPA